MTDKTSSRARSRWFLYLTVVLGVAVAVWYFGFRSEPQKPRYPQPPWAGKSYPWLIPVSTVAAQAKDLPVYLKAIGTVTPLNTVTVKSRVDGQLLRVAFEEGQQVEQGQLLAEIDPGPYQIRLAQVEGQLQQNAAQMKNARADLERIRSLHERKLVTDQQLDTQVSLTSESEGAFAAMQAQVENARLQLAYTHIEAPIAGRVGLRRVDAGNLVRQGDANGIVVITQTRPISVSFTIPEVDLQSVLDPYRAGEKLVVEAWDRRETNLLTTGRLKTLDNQIDAATGTLRLKAEFANEDERLFPNQFVNVRMLVRTLDKAVVIPSAAVQFGSRGTYVFVVNEKNIANVRDIVLGATDGAEQAVTKGLQPGEAVVLEGLDRLRDGSGVVLGSDLPPAATPPTAKKKAKAP